MRTKALGLLLLFCSAVVCTCGAEVQHALVTVIVEPRPAHIFVDGNAIRHGSGTLHLVPGRHEISVHNYGYKPIIRDVDLTSGEKQELKFTLERVGGNVSGPFGVIQIEGNRNAAVLLNGNKPEYFVGHGDEVNNHIIWKQQLVVPAGTHIVSELTGVYKRRADTILARLAA